jgi:hypothetical protein
MRFCCRAERQTPVLRYACGNAFCQRQPANGRVCLIEFSRRSAGSKASAQYYAGDCLSFLLERALLFHSGRDSGTGTGSLSSTGIGTAFASARSGGEGLERRRLALAMRHASYDRLAVIAD